MDSHTSEFEQIIAGILCTDNERRRQAEQAYFNIQSNGNLFFSILTVLLVSSPNFQSRIFAAVLMRQQLLPNKKLFDDVTPEVRQELKQACIHLFQTESNVTIRNKVIELMSVLAARIFTTAQQNNASDITSDWPEVIPLTMSGCASTMPPQVQEACFQMFNKLSEFCISSLLPVSQNITALFMEGMDSPLLSVAVAAANSTLSVLASLLILATQTPTADTAQYIEAAKPWITQYNTILPKTCGVLQRACGEGDSLAVSELVQSLEHIIRLSPRSFSECIEPFIALIDTIARQDEFDPSLRHSAVSCLISFGANPPGRLLIRGCPAYQKTLLTLCYDFLERIELSDKWSQDPHKVTEDEEDFPDHYMGIHIIENLPLALGLKAFMSKLLIDIMKRAQRPNWKSQLASLTILHTVAREFLRGFPKTSLQPLSNMLITLLTKQNSNDRVRAAICSSISNMAEKLTQTIGAEHLPHIIAMVNPQNSPTLIYFAMHAMSNLIGLLKPARIRAHLETILGATIGMLSHPNLAVKLLSLSAISSVALNQEGDFGQYCDQIVSGLTQMIRQTNQDIESNQSLDWETRTELRRMRSKAVETLSYIATAVGAQAFAPYLQVCVALMAEAQQQELKAVNPEVDLILGSYERLSEALGASFFPFVPLVLPGIFESAAAENYIYRFDLDENSQLSFTDQAKAEELTKERGFHSISVALRGVGNQKMFLNVSVVQDKIQALELIGQFAISLGEAFAPYINQAAAVLFPCCTATSNPRIRMSAVTSVPALLECVSKQPNISPEVVMDFFTQCLQAFDLEVWIAKELPEGLSFLLGAITACIDVLPHPLPIPQLEFISKSLLAALELSKERRRSIEDDVEGSDEEHVEDKAEAMAQENRVLDSIIALNTELVRKNPQEYMPFFDNVLSGELELMINSQATDPYMAVCGFVGFADTIGTAKELAKKYIPHVLPRFIQHVSNQTDHELRRGCAYGIAACHKQLTADEFAPFLQTVVKVLVDALAIDEVDPELSEDCEYATDNVLVGLCDIVTRFGFGDHAIPDFAAGLIPHIMPKLGRFHDEEECKSIHKNFVYWLTEAPQLVYGTDTSTSLPHLISAIASILDYDQEYDIIDEEDKQRLLDFWRGFRTTIGPQIMEKILQFVPPEIRSLLQFE